jgi:methionine-rich copper-binding protein CopC
MNLKNLFAAAALALGAASTAQAHAHLESSLPKADSVVDAPPKQLRLQFNEMLEPAFSKVKLTGANNAAIALTAVGVDKTNNKAIIATVPPLPSGQYRVQWSAAAHDGHVTKGELSFRVK